MLNILIALFCLLSFPAFAQNVGLTLSGAYTAGHCTQINAGGFSLSDSGAACGGSGSGTVNSGTQYQLGYYATTGTAISGIAGIVTDSSSDLNLTFSGAKYQINSVNALSFPISDTTAGASIAIGSSALSGQTSSAAYGNTAVGYQALDGTMTTAAVGETALGYQAAHSVTTGNYNTAIGNYALYSNTTGQQNVALGGNSVNYAPLYKNTTGNANVAVGQGSLDANISGGNNVGVGNTSLQNTTGSNNVGIGYSGGGLISSGNNNVAIGYQVATIKLTTGSNNILIGTNNTVDTVASSTSNEINIGGLLFYNNNSTAAPAISACGTSPSIDTYANNKSGTVTVGTTATSCTVTLAGTGYGTWNHCRVTSESTIAAFAYSYTTTVLTVTGTSLGGDKFDYDCDGV